MGYLVFLIFSLTDNLKVTEFYLLNDSFSLIKLKKYPIIKNSETLYFNGKELKRDFYSFDYEKGIVKFKDFLTTGSLKVIYYYLPFSLSPLPKIAVKDSVGDTSITYNQKETVNNENSSEIIFEGKKELKINYSSKEGVGVEQQTNFSLNSAGEIAVEGIFNTKEEKENSFLLRELANSYLKVKAKNTAFIIGKQNKEINFSPFGKLSEEGIGFSLSQTNMMETINFNYLQTPFKYGKVQFYGKDFIQGPYYLKKEGPIKILPNSERVYLDGRLLKRGNDEDYLIDYELGAINFTNRLIITSRNFIEVDFLYEEDGERNNFDFHFLTNRLPVKTEINCYFEKEQNKEYLDKETKNYLAKIGNDTNQAYILSAFYVGKNNGDYEKEGEIFFYVGEKRGSYLVNFTFVGENKGDYEYDNLRNCYYYVGKNKGKYSPYKKIELPKKNNYYSLKFSLPLNDNLNFQFGGLINEKDENLFSPLGDTNPFSYGINLAFNYQKEMITLDGAYCQIFKNHHLLNQLQTEDLIAIPLKNKTTFKFTFSPFEHLNFNNQINLIMKKEKSWEYFGENEITFYFNQVKFSKNCYGKKEITFSTTPHYRFFYPHFSLSYQADSGNYFLTNSLGSSFYFNDKKFFFDYQQEKEKIARKIIQKIGFDFNNPKTTIIFGKLKKDYLTPTLTDENSYFGNLNFDYSFKEFLKFNWEWKLTNEEEVLKEVRYIKVKKGEGNYAKDTITNEYYPDEKGEYRQEIIPLRKGKAILKNELKNNMEISLKEKMALSFYTNFISPRNFLYNFNGRYYFKNGLLINYQGNYFKNSEEELKYNNLENSVIVKKEILKEIYLGSSFKYFKNKKNRISSYHFQEEKIVISPFWEIAKGIELNLSPIFSFSNYHYFSPISDNYKIKKIGLDIKGSTDIFKNWYLDALLNIGYRFYEKNKILPTELTFWEPQGFYYDFNSVITQNISNNFMLNWNFSYRKEGFKEKEISFSFSTTLYF
jgi:hypothetical protein